MTQYHLFLYLVSVGIFTNSITFVAWEFLELFAICKTPFDSKLKDDKNYFSAVALDAGFVDFFAVFIV